MKYELGEPREIGRFNVNTIKELTSGTRNCQSHMTVNETLSSNFTIFPIFT